MTMKAMLGAAILVVSPLGTSSKYDCDGDTYSATRLFTSIPGEQLSLVAAAHRRAVIVQVEGAARSYVTISRRGTWLFQSAPTSGEL
jgi:hypothetical protein